MTPGTADCEARPELWATVAPGAGPRQVAVHPHGTFAYMINELNSTMSAYHYDGATGTLHEVQTVLHAAWQTSRTQAPAPRCR